MNEVMSVREASKVAGCSLSTMRRWLSSGRIMGATKGEQGWLVSHTNLKKFLTEQLPIVGHLREQTSTRSPTQESNQVLAQQLIHKLESDLQFERNRAEKLNDECLLLRQENKSLQEEIKALLKRDNVGVLSRWIRTVSW